MIKPDFYYEPDIPILRVSFGVSGLFLSLYGLGCLLFLWVLLRSTAYAKDGGATS